MGRIVNHAIPNLINGVSQQPETLRLSSQGNAQENGYSSVVEGLKKRPPTEFVKKIKTSTLTNAFVHTINRDSSERYFVVITDDDIEVYDTDGTEKTIVDGVGSSFGTYIDDSDPKSNFEAVTIADYTFIINKNKTTALSGSTDASRPYEAVYSITQGVSATEYELKLAGSTYSYTTTDTASTYDAIEIASQMVTAIGSPSGFTITNLGTDIYISHASDFTIKASDGYGSQASQVIKGEAQKFSDLPKKAVNGFVAEITNDAGNNFDNYFVKYESDSNDDVGVWKETVKPALDNNVDVSTMPHVLIRTADSNFRFDQCDGGTYTIAGTDYTVPKWTGRVVGDETSSPMPTFVGKKINDIFFFRNRLGFIAGDNVFMSRAGDFFELHPETVTTILDSDPIDISVSHTKVAQLRHAIPFDEELLIFSDQSQFILGGGQALLTPKNVNINVTTEFETSLLAKPVGAGKNVYFAFTKGEYSGMREFFVNAESDTNDATDTTAHVPKYIPKNVFKMATATNENILVCLSSEEQNALYVYQWYVANEQKLQSSWSKWSFGNSTDNTILNIDFIDTKLYILMQNSNGVEILTIETAPAHTDPDGATYLSHLDRKVNESTTGLTKSYSSGTGNTTITLPYTIDNTMEMVTRNVTGSSTIAGQKVTIATQADGGAVIVVSGDYSSEKFFIGEVYTFNYEFSQQYLQTQSNVTGTRSAIKDGRLSIKNWTVGYNNTGYFQTSVTPVGRDESIDTFTGAIVSGAVVNGVNLEDGNFTFTTLSRNDQLTVKITNNSHLPSNFINAEWQAYYNTTS